MKTFDEKVNWIIKQHEDTNHMYDKYLPYEFHLRMVNQVAKEFKHLIPTELHNDIFLAAFGHDLIEDTRITYNDVKKELGEFIADIIYALTNEKGKNRKERANDKYYQGIRDCPCGVFIKLCDRIANVRYGKITGSKMVSMYEKENENFISKLGYYKGNDYEEIFDYLNNLFKN
jgi:(p)ppGpp synthase/HD superfamily hydrolase